MNAGILPIASAAPKALDPQQSWVPWLMIIVVLAVLVIAYSVLGRSRAARRGASALGASVAGVEAVLRPSRRHVLEAKSKRRKQEEGSGEKDQPSP